MKHQVARCASPTTYHPNELDAHAPGEYDAVTYGGFLEPATQPSPRLQAVMTASWNQVEHTNSWKHRLLVLACCFLSLSTAPWTFSPLSVSWMLVAPSPNAAPSEEETHGAEAPLEAAIVGRRMRRVRQPNVSQSGLLAATAVALVHRREYLHRPAVMLREHALRFGLGAPLRI